MKLIRSLALVLALAMLAGCSNQAAVPSTEPDPENLYIDPAPIVEIVEIDDEAVAMSEAPAPATPIMLKPVASGSRVEQNNQAVIDYSNITDGYAMVKCSSPSGKTLKVIVYGPSYDTNQTKYTYNLDADQWTTFPLSDGNGSYKITVYENTSGTNYATVLSASFTVTLTDEFAPFLRPNQYVNYEDQPNTIEKAAQLTQDISDPLEKVAVVYDFVVNNLTYDRKLATAVSSGEVKSYLPDLDSVLASGKGICFDYAALMAGMLRSQGVPCKLVTGYAGKTFHAWVSVWTEDSGWVDGAIFFDGSTWHRMDPTFISSGKNSAAIQKYVGNGSNYTEMYLY